MNVLPDHLDVVLQPAGKVRRVPIAADFTPTGGGHETAVLLTHGASGSLHSGNLDTIAAAIAEAGLPCLRFTCLGPLAHRAAVAAAVLAAATGALPEFALVRRWVAAGHSMGGRVACELAAAAPDTVAAVLLLSYPLHPPNQPAQLRDAPLAELRQPALFVRGTRDPFCTSAPWEALRPRLRSRQVAVHSVDGGDHALAVAGGAEASGEALQAATAAVQRFVRGVAAAKRARRAAAGPAGPQPKRRLTAFVLH
jgi:hypothetical protein